MEHVFIVVTLWCVSLLLPGSFLDFLVTHNSALLVQHLNLPLFVCGSPPVVLESQRTTVPSLLSFSSADLSPAPVGHSSGNPPHSPVFLVPGLLGSGLLSKFDNANVDGCLLSSSGWNRLWFSLTAAVEEQCWLGTMSLNACTLGPSEGSSGKRCNSEFMRREPRRISLSGSKLRSSSAISKTTLNSMSDLLSPCSAAVMKSASIILNNGNQHRSTMCLSRKPLVWYYAPAGVTIQAEDFGGLNGIRYLDYISESNSSSNSFFNATYARRGTTKSRLPDWQQRSSHRSNSHLKDCQKSQRRQGMIGTRYMDGLASALQRELRLEEGQSLFGLPYDWRLPPYQIDWERVRRLIEEAVEVNDGKKAVFIAHSLGTLYLNYFLTQKVTPTWKEHYVDRMISISSTFGGSVNALWAVLASFGQESHQWPISTASTARHNETSNEGSTPTSPPSSGDVTSMLSEHVTTTGATSDGLGLQNTERNSSDGLLQSLHDANSLLTTASISSLVPEALTPYIKSAANSLGTL
eukprot:GHVQ01023080.1.p2 GENE.GHVQ01023080.1~~GHVQ01023080.1.p2  ORF type:complete len:545 (-),score=47.36 GHVQ01023080.1:4070-5635(-)